MDALLASVQIIISFVLSLGHVLIPLFMLSGLGLGSQFGFTSLDQSRGEIDSVFFRGRIWISGLSQLISS